MDFEFAYNLWLNKLLKKNIVIYQWPVNVVQLMDVE
jgi:hypothetical protein